MTESPDTHATGRHTREGSSNGGDFQVDPGQSRLKKLFLLPNGEPASFLLHNIESAYLSKRIFEHGGHVTDDDDAADVILTTSRDEYKYLKDKYAISQKTHVRMSGFVDRCVDSRRFRLAPIVEKGVPGRRLASRRVEFTKDDDEYLCQYIAEVLPDKEDGGRTGHFIYVDLLRRAHEFGQYSWAHRHPKDSWRERYRKNRDRMDKRIAEIAEENTPAFDGKGLYRSRRFGNIDQDDEWMNADDEPADLDEGEKSESATDNEDGPVQVQIRKKDVQRREEEEEEEEDVGAATHQSSAAPSLPGRGAETQGGEEVEEQSTELQPETGPPPDVAARRSRVSLRREPIQTRRRTKGSSQVFEEVIPEDIDATLRGAEVYDKLVDERGPPPFDSPEADFPVAHEQSYPQEAASETAEPESGKRKRASAITRLLVPPPSPRRTRARSREHSVNPPEAVPEARVPEGRKRRWASARGQQSVSPRSPRRTRARSREHSVNLPKAAHVTVRTRSSARTRTMATATATTALKPISGSQVADEFVAHSGDESEMDEVEANLQLSTGPRGAPIVTHSLNVEDLRVSPRQQVVLPQNTIVADPDGDEDDEDDDDAELLEYVRKLDVHAARPQPTVSQNEGGKPGRGPSEEMFPFPGTQAEAEKRRRTQALKDAPYVLSSGTRAASMREKDLYRAARGS